MEALLVHQLILLFGTAQFTNLNNDAPARMTEVSIQGDSFLINGQLTYEGQTWSGQPVEGLLFNARMVQGIFDDMNPDTAGLWAYTDTGTWDPERNTAEFIEAMGHWRDHGLLAFTLNLQGGCPYGYCSQQPWQNSAITYAGNLRPEYMTRLERVLDRADELGMVVILGIYYFGQDQHLQDEAAVINGVDNTVDWILERNYRNVIIEINNECNISYDHSILKPNRVHELIQRIKSRTDAGYRLLASTSFSGGVIPTENVVRHADFILLHGNGVSNALRIAAMVDQTRQVPGYQAKPILFNEDDHYDFDESYNNMVAALSAYASWGFFDPGTGNYWDGYQSLPVNWEINTPTKRAFFCKLDTITGGINYTQKSTDSCNCDRGFTDAALVIPPAPACGLGADLAVMMTGFALLGLTVVMRLRG